MQNFLWYFVVFSILCYLVFDEWREAGVKGAVKFLIIFGTLFIIIHTYIAKPFMVDGPSMSPTFETGDYLLVERFKAKFDGIKRHDVVVFDIPETNYSAEHEYHTCYIPIGDTCYWKSKRYLVKRIIGLPGERVSVINGATTIYNKEHPEGILLDSGYVLYPSPIEAEVQLSQEEYFVMGDNRSNSADSRYFGPVPAENIIGVPFLRLLPLREIGTFPGGLEDQKADN